MTDFREELAEEYGGVILLDPPEWDSAILGIVYNHDCDYVAVYDYHQLATVISREDPELTYEDACEHIEFNIIQHHTKGFPLVLDQFYAERSVYYGEGVT